MSKKAILIITDGVGYNPSNENNAFANASTPTYDHLFASYPNSKVATSGLAVGLPEGQMGNSEVGHMTIGSGRVIYQDLVRIDKAIEDDTLISNEVVAKISQSSKDIHLIGLCSDGGVHSHIEHIIYLAKKLSLGHKVHLHLITDGRDTAPDSATKYIRQILAICSDKISIASVSGRFYAMDRDNNWDRIKKSFDAIYNGDCATEKSVSEYIANSYLDEVYDEFIEPANFGGFGGFQDGDGVLFCNFRSDRMRELVMAVGESDFSEFTKKTKQLYIATMTSYKDSFSYAVVFDKTSPKNTLAETIANNNLSQFHTAETEKYAHVTFFLNGGVEKCYPKETHSLVPSPKVKTYDMQPEMSAVEVADELLKAMDAEYDFIVVNFANGDMVGHTGNYDASIKAIECVDAQIGRIVEKAKTTEYNILITSDHGNCEQMKDKEGNRLTNHTTFDVFCICVAEGVSSLKDGALNNIAPTILELMELEVPSEMDESLLGELY